MDSDHPPSDSIIGLLIIAAVLITLSMIFSASESAFLSINKLRVRFLRNQKNKRAVRTWYLLNDREKLINTLLVGNNIVNIAISSIITIIAMDLFGDAGVGIATFVVTLLLLVFGEITPKTIATRHPEPIAFFFSGFIRILEVILSPFVFLFTVLSRFILKVFRVDISKRSISFTEEEIKTFLDVGEEEGVLENNEKNMMRQVFKFTDLEAKDIMIPRKKIISVTSTKRYSEIIELSERYRLSRFPVYKKDIDDIIGIIYVKDLIVFRMHPTDFNLEQVMRPPLFILESKKMSSIQQMLKENKQSMAVVIDEYSGTSGILTSEDIEREIFGTVSDEYSFSDKSNSDKMFKKIPTNINFTKLNTQGIEIDGSMRLIDLNEQLHITLFSDNSETIGGFICETLGHIPIVGERILVDDYLFTVSLMDDKRVAEVHIISNKESEI